MNTNMTGFDGFCLNFLRHCALDKSSLSIVRVKIGIHQYKSTYKRRTLKRTAPARKCAFYDPQ